MNTKETLAAISAHLDNILKQSYTVCAFELAAAIKATGIAAGLAVMTGQCDGNTCVLYVEC